MADKRINALANTASSTASDDFIAVDGTTNGTRKLSAFSPTFGGNATVTGTLSSAGNLSVTGTSAQIILGQSSGSQLTYLIRSAQAGGAIQMVQDSATINRWLSLGGCDNTGVYSELMRVAGATGNILVTSTVASTTTSTGALVVGNGTSGGLGVGGAASIGGPILVGTSSDVYVSRVGTGILDIRSASSPGTTARLDVTGTTSAGVGFRQSGARDWFISAESNELRVSCLTAASIFAFNSGTPVAMRDTTASTSTSSGALVVSGGVGVAKRIFTGEGLTVSADSDTQVTFVRNGTVSIGPTSSAAPKLSISSAVVLAAATQSLATWGDIGAQFAVSGSVLTDTQSSGTVSRCVLNSFASTNVAAAGATTFTQAATLFVAGGPTAGTNVTITNAYAIYTAGGRINFQGLPTSSAGLQAGTLWNDSGTLKVA